VRSAQQVSIDERIVEQQLPYLHTVGNAERLRTNFVLGRVLPIRKVEAHQACMFTQELVPRDAKVMFCVQPLKTCLGNAAWTVILSSASRARPHSLYLESLNSFEVVSHVPTCGIGRRPSRAANTAAASSAFFWPRCSWR